MVKGFQQLTAGDMRSACRTIAERTRSRLYIVERNPA
jgi:hypothetical protein